MQVALVTSFEQMPQIGATEAELDLDQNTDVSYCSAKTTRYLNGEKNIELVTLKKRKISAR